MTGIERLRRLDRENEELRDMLNQIAWHLGLGDEVHYYSGDNYAACQSRVLDAIEGLTERESDVETVRSDAMEAWEWVRDHGGLSHVKDILHDFRAVVERIGVEWSESELHGLMYALDRRLMPEGMEWPRFEDGEPVRIGDEVVDEAGEIVYRVSEIAFSDGYGTCLRYEDPRDGNSYNFIDGLEPGKRVKRPAVLASDGEPLEVGQTVWDTNGDELVIGALEDGGHTVACRYADVGDGIPVHGMWSPSDLTHQRPVLDADGVPIKKGEHVFGPNGGQYRVTSAHDGKVFARHVDGPSGAEVESAGGEGLYRLRADKLTHAKPEIDTWQRIEEDARLKPFGYVDRVLGWDMSKSHSQNQARSAMTHDLVRRAKALAERGR